AGARSRGRFDQGGCAMSVVENVMVREVIAVARDTSLAAVARLFALHRIAGAPVVDDNGRPMGIVSRTDLVDPDRRRARRAGPTLFYHLRDGDITAVGTLLADPAGGHGVAEDVMSAPLITIDHRASLADAARRMVDEGVRRLFVSRRGKIVGMVS